MCVISTRHVRSNRGRDVGGGSELWVANAQGRIINIQQNIAGKLILFFYFYSNIILNIKHPWHCLLAVLVKLIFFITFILNIHKDTPMNPGRSLVICSCALRVTVRSVHAWLHWRAYHVAWRRSARRQGGQGHPRSHRKWYRDRVAGCTAGNMAVSQGSRQLETLLHSYSAAL